MQEERRRFLYECCFTRLAGFLAFRCDQYLALLQLPSLPLLFVSACSRAIRARTIRSGKQWQITTWLILAGKNKPDDSVKLWNQSLCALKLSKDPHYLAQSASRSVMSLIGNLKKKLKKLRRPKKGTIARHNPPTQQPLHQTCNPHPPSPTLFTRDKSDPITSLQKPRFLGMMAYKILISTLTDSRVGET